MILILFFWLIPPFPCDSRSENDNFIYTLHISPSNPNAQYTIIAPVPIRYNYPEREPLVPSEFIELISVDVGEASYGIVETEYGFALEVSGNGHVILNCSDPDGDILYDHLNLQNETFIRKGDAMIGSHEYRLFLNSSISVDIEIHCFGEWGGGWCWDSQTSEISGTLTNGWNLADGHESHKTS